MEQPQIVVDASPLAGLRILIVEDMFLVADDLAEQLNGWSCHVVGPEARVKDALARIAESELDGALLDVNLGKEWSFDIAVELASRNVPFIFLTGYDRDTVFPGDLHSRPKLSKPVDSDALAKMIEQHFRR
jgi:two-component SAPR family response regulator